MESFTQDRNGTGTREWSEFSYNIGFGCSHDCRYCYARSNAVDRWKRIKPEEWTTERINQRAIKRNWIRRIGVIMYPTTHDITPFYLEPSIDVLKKMLTAGNNVLIVSKPHMECVVKMCDELERWKKQILFRFTIGSMDAELCKLWEPGAPGPMERWNCLKLAYNTGFNTSVSIEPNLGGTGNAIDVVNWVYGFVTHDIWIGKMNKIETRVPANMQREIERIRIAQCDESTMLLYENLKNEPKVRWKDSIKKIMQVY